jgi:hypothetical protein
VTQRRRVKGDVVRHERLDEVVAVVVMRVTPQLHLLPGPLAGVLEQLGPQLPARNLSPTLVDQIVSLRGACCTSCVAS